MAFLVLRVLIFLRVLLELFLANIVPTLKVGGLGYYFLGGKEGTRNKIYDIEK